MWSWYAREILIPGRQPLFLALVAFLLTLLVTRFITRTIRSGKGPFQNVSAGGTHIHHVVPGLILLLIGGLLALGATEGGFWRHAAGILFGIGAALVLDEFAMILHLDDVYWAAEGRLSADVAMLAAVIMLGGLVVAAPNNPPKDEAQGLLVNVVGGALFVLVWLIPMLITVMKGKYWMAAAGIALIPFLWIGAIRLARPVSPWAHFRYRNKPAKMAKAEARDQKWVRLQDPPLQWVRTHVFGLGPQPGQDG